MDDFELDGERYRIERAGADDVQAIADLMADDVLGVARESDDLAKYEKAFAKSTLTHTSSSRWSVMTAGRSSEPCS